MRAQIVMATHNPRPGLLERQVDSLLAQTERDWHCLVLDDASDDRAAVASALTDDRFTLLPGQPRLGPYGAFAHLLDLADPGVPVFLCDQDDFWHPHKLRAMLSVPGTVYSAMRVVDEHGAVMRQRFLPPPTDLTPAGLLLMNCVSGAALKVSPEVRRAAVPLPAAHARGWHDQWLAAVAARLGEIVYLDEVLVDYTRHGGQVVGDGLRRLTGKRLAQFVAAPEMRSRTEWVMGAARRLLSVPGPADPDLESIAAGRFRTAARGHDVPWQRMALLTAGRVGSRL